MFNQTQTIKESLLRSEILELKKQNMELQTLIDFYEERLNRNIPKKTRGYQRRKTIPGHTKKRRFLSEAEKAEMILFWKQRKVNQKKLALMFDVSESTVTRVLDKGRPDRIVKSIDEMTEALRVMKTDG